MNRSSSEMATMPCTAENRVRARASKIRRVQRRPQHGERLDQMLDEHRMFGQMPFGHRHAGRHAVLEQRRPQHAVVAREGEVGPWPAP